MLPAGSLNDLCHKYTSFFFKNKELIIRIHDYGKNIRNVYTSSELIYG